MFKTEMRQAIRGDWLPLNFTERRTHFENGALRRGRRDPPSVEAVREMYTIGTLVNFVAVTEEDSLASGIMG